MNVRIGDEASSSVGAQASGSGSSQFAKKTTEKEVRHRQSEKLCKRTRDEVEEYRGLGSLEDRNLAESTISHADGRMVFVTSVVGAIL